jgi:hypothetical protein
MVAPSVSVLLPVYNGAAFLRGAIDSVLAQSFRDFELLVIDDGSSDGSADIALSAGDPRVRVLRNERNLGLAGTLNVGLEAARAPLVARQDADDISLPERLARQTAFADAHPEIALVGTQGWAIDAAGRKCGDLDKPREAAGIAWLMMFDNAFLHTSVLFRRDVVQALGGYDPTFVYCQDYELWSRLLMSHPAANLPERLVLSRLHGGSMTETVQKEYGDQALGVMARNQSAALGQSLPRAEAELLARIRAGIPADRKQYVLECLERRRAELVARRPEAAASADFRATVGRQRGQVVASCGFRPYGLVMSSSPRFAAGYPAWPTVLRHAWWAVRNRLGI